MQNRILTKLSLLLMLSCYAAFVAAVEGRILDSIESEQAGLESFVAEEKIFKNIGHGIALSLAYCELEQNCTPSVDQAELDTLLNQLDNRINNLILKQEDAEADYSEILTAYVNHRENYLDYQQKLDEIVGVEESDDALTEEELFPTETEADTTVYSIDEAPVSETMDFSIFEDVDEALPGESLDDELVEDESLEGLPEDIPEDLQ